MPELPEVEAVVRHLREGKGAATIASVHVERLSTIAPQKPKDFSVLVGKRIADVRRRAKYILIDVGAGLVVQTHLRMTGKLYFAPDYRLLAAGVRVWFRLKDGRALVFADSRALGKMHLRSAADVEALESGLGPEPLEEAFKPSVLRGILKPLRAPVKPVLMDQKRIAGIGNIYASEALWHARIDPRSPAGSIASRKVSALHAAILKVLRTAVSTVYEKYESDESSMAVYGKKGQPCPRCSTAVERIVQAGRSTYFCPRCQK